VAKCKTYGPELVPTMEKMFDQLGGLDRLVKGKTVAVKSQPHRRSLAAVGRRQDGGYLLDASPHDRRGGALMGKAGARRIRVVEGAWSSAETARRGHAVP
jgi:hypothetical protein